jgi:hypothetical protein
MQHFRSFMHLDYKRSYKGVKYYINAGMLD